MFSTTRRWPPQLKIVPVQYTKTSFKHRPRRWVLLPIFVADWRHWKQALKHLQYSVLLSCRWVWFSLMVIHPSVAFIFLLLFSETLCFGLSSHQCVYECVCTCVHPSVGSPLYFLNEWRHLNESGHRWYWWHWEGHWFKGQGQPVVTENSYEHGNSWTSEGISTKHKYFP